MKHLSDFHAFVAQRSNPPPDVLFKYIAQDSALKVLGSSALLWRSPLTFNDPFDCHWDPFWPLDTEEAARTDRELHRRALLDHQFWSNSGDKKLKAAFRRERRRIKNLPEEKRAAAVESALDQILDSRDRASSFRDQLHDIRKRMRLLCLSEAPASLLMLSHYAENNTGAVLSLSRQRLEEAWKVPVYPVRYMDSPPTTIDTNRILADILLRENPSTQIEDLDAWTLTKHSDWKYEQEWRFVTLQPHGVKAETSLVPFPALLLL